MTILVYEAFFHASPVIHVVYITFQAGRLTRSAPTQAPVGAFFYALRASRSVVVSLSLSRRNAASESEESKKGLPHVRQSLFLCYFRQHGGNLESSPVFVFPLDEKLPEQLPQQLAVPLNRPRIW